MSPNNSSFASTYKRQTTEQDSALARGFTAVTGSAFGSDCVFFKLSSTIIDILPFSHESFGQHDAMDRKVVQLMLWPTIVAVKRLATPLSAVLIDEEAF